MLNKILIFVASFAFQCSALVEGGGGNVANKYERPIKIREYIERKQYKGYKEENHQTIVVINASLMQPTLVNNVNEF